MLVLVLVAMPAFLRFIVFASAFSAAFPAFFGRPVLGRGSRNLGVPLRRLGRKRSESGDHLFDVRSDRVNFILA